MKYWPIADYPRTPPEIWCSIDPGISKGGMAVWQGKKCLAAWKSNPQETLERVADQEAEWGLVICERFSLYPEYLAQHSHDEMWTSQMIGALRWTCFSRGIPFITQQASVMKGFRKGLDSRAWDLACPATNEDARCAYYHGAWAVERKMIK